MRADRLVSLVLLLRQRGRLTAEALATELEVSVRTILRDIEALSAAGVPVYAERGRHGGFALLPGFRTELTGLNQDEALALLAADGRFGLALAQSAALRKVVDAMPATQRLAVAGASQRLLVDPEHDLLWRTTRSDPAQASILGEVRRAVIEGRKLAFNYASPTRPPSEVLVDPVGLVTVRARTYLLALKEGADRTYRVDRMTSATVSEDLAERPTEVDLAQLWRQRSAQFLAGDRLVVAVDIAARSHETLAGLARSTRLTDDRAPTGATTRVRVSAEFDDLRHAIWALWQVAADVQVLSPESVRTAIRQRAASVLDTHT